MRSALLLLPLSACVAAGPSGPDHAGQEAACAAVIAAHVRRPVAEVQPRWLSEANGIARVETLDGSRRHICEVDAAGRVLGYIHPDA